MEKMFETALRKKIRFGTVKGLATIEDIWQAPLTSRDDYNLDVITKKVAKDLKDSESESFVKPVTSGNSILSLKLELLKHVIKVKLEEEKEKEDKVEKQARKARILDIMARKQDQELEGKSLEDLQKELASL